MLTALLFAAVLAAAPDAVDAPPTAPLASPAASSEDQSDALGAVSLSEDDLATEAARVTGRPQDDPANPAQGGAQLAQQPYVALDRSRIENFTPPPPEPVAAPSLGGFGFAATFGR